MTTTQEAREAHDREVLLDQQEQRVRCKACGAPLIPENGIIHTSTNPPSGESIWQCMNPACGRRIREYYEVREKIVTLKVEGV